jgi:uncharacterized protein YqgV (UPF0045/DUF77 family)
MNITVEISMYPLREDYIDQVLGFLERLSKNDKIHIRVNALSTQVQGDTHVVMNALRDAIAATFSDEIRASFVMKILPGDIDLNYSYPA